jgi:TolB-like protein
VTRIGPWQVDPAQRLLTDGTVSATLPPRSWEVLEHLLAHRGELVRTRTLLEAFWRGELADEAYVRKSISQIRKALGDDARRQRYIRTVSKQGYVLTAEADAGEGVSPVPGAAEPVLVVLPFASFSGDPENEHFCDGLTEEVVNKLSQRLRTPVIARTSAFQFKGVGADVRDIGRALNASHVLEGSVRRAGRRVRVTAQLIEAVNGAHLWSETYERDLADLFAVQDQVADGIGAAVERRLVGTDPAGPVPRTVFLSRRFMHPTEFSSLVAAIQASADGKPSTDGEKG